MATATERRRHVRFSVPCRLRVEVGAGNALRVRTLNVSDGGAYFVTEEGFEIGRRVRVRLSVPRDTANTFFLEQFAAEAEVVRLDRASPGQPAAGVALAFATRLALDLA
jgi:c-di-GMP-binding flagellar brake protein YcgR